MRWAYEGVHFEPSGVDHSSPGSSFQVGGLIVDEVFGGEAPIGPMYAFVGITGQAKMSSSRGSVPTPGDALEILEVPVLRWLFARRRGYYAGALGRRVLRAVPLPGLDPTRGHEQRPVYEYLPRPVVLVLGR